MAGVSVEEKAWLAQLKAWQEIKNRRGNNLYIDRETETGKLIGSPYKVDHHLFLHMIHIESM